MLKHIIAYSCRLLILFTAGIALITWLIISKVQNLDSLEVLSDAMGLSRDWQGRADILEKRHPWDREKSASWAAQELDSFLAVKSELMPALTEWHRRYPSALPDPKPDLTGPGSNGMMADILHMRATLLSALERHRLSLTAYRFFNELAADFNQRGERAAAEHDLSDPQREALLLLTSVLRTVDSSGVEFLGLPR